MAQAQAAARKAEADSTKAYELREKAKTEYDSRCQKYTESLLKLTKAQDAADKALKVAAGKDSATDQLNVEALLEGTSSDQLQ